MDRTIRRRPFDVPTSPLIAEIKAWDVVCPQYGRYRHRMLEHNELLQRVARTKVLDRGLKVTSAELFQCLPFPRETPGLQECRPQAEHASNQRDSPDYRDSVISRGAGNQVVPCRESDCGGYADSDSG